MFACPGILGGLGLKWTCENEPSIASTTMSKEVEES